MTSTHSDPLDYITPSSVLKATDALWGTGIPEVQQHAFSMLRGHYKRLADSNSTPAKPTAVPASPVEPAPSRFCKIYETSKEVMQAGMNIRDTKEYADQILKMFKTGAGILSYEDICSKLVQMRPSVDGWELESGDYAHVRHGDGSRIMYRRRASDALGRLVKEGRLYRPSGGQFYERDCVRSVQAAA